MVQSSRQWQISTPKQYFEMHTPYLKEIIIFLYFELKVKKPDSQKLV